MTARHPLVDLGFAGAIIQPADADYDARREIWNAMVDRHPRVIALCSSATDVVAAVRYGREAGLEIGVKSGGHGVLGMCVPEDGLMIDLSPMSSVRVDPARQRATVGGGALLRSLDAETDAHGLATTAGNVSHTGVGGLTLGGGMGWLARQFGLACDNVEAYTLATADGAVVQATATENPDLFWGLRGGGGNFGIVTQFVFRLHPTTGHALAAELFFDPSDHAGLTAVRTWRDLLGDAPRPATLTCDVLTAPQAPFLPTALHGQPIVSAGFAWVGNMDEARTYLEAFRRAMPEPLGEQVEELRYVALQRSGDDRHHHGLRRYSAGHYLPELSDAAIDAFLARGIPASGPEPDWSLIPGGGFQAYGGAIAEVGEGESAFSHRDTLVEFFTGAAWADPAEDAVRMAVARTWATSMEPFSSGVYVNVVADAGVDPARSYTAGPLARLAELKRTWDPDNVFHRNQNIRPAPAS